ncbi:BioY family transporter [Spirochaetota bacterium]
MKQNSYKLVLSSLFAALIAGGAVFSIPLPPPLLPVTLAVFFCLLAGLILGPFYGLLSVLVYLAIGSVGLPVFANGAGGFGQFAGPSGGFLAAYAPLAFVSGLLSDRKAWSFVRGIAAAMAGVAVLYLIGLPVFRMVLDGSPGNGLSMAGAFAIMAPYLLGDVLKAVAAAALVSALRPLLSNYLPNEKAK